MTVLVIHQSAELYGSDKMLLYLVSALGKQDVSFVVVVPSNGPLCEELKKEGAEIIIAPVLKISRKMFSPAYMLSLPFQVVKGFLALRNALGKRKIDLVYSNTLAVLLGALYAKRYRLPHLWHIHEIIEHPKFISRTYPKLVKYFSKTAVFNSFATYQFMLSQLPSLGEISKVIHNGIDRPETFSDRTQTRRELFKLDDDTILIALVGRISRWKGQLLLLEAFAAMQQGKDVKLAFVGSPPPGQDHFKTKLEEAIALAGLANKTQIVPFTNDVWAVWEAIDIAVVASTEPEPFGLVAVEAMLAKKPVVAANHGGLTEIIIHNQTGFLFSPGNAIMLAGYLSELCDSAELREKFGNNGYETARRDFSLQSYSEQFRKLFSSTQVK